MSAHKNDTFDERLTAAANAKKAMLEKFRVESWRRHHNTIRPHASLGFRPPAPEVFVPAFAAWPAALRRPASPSAQTVAPRPTLN